MSFDRTSATKVAADRQNQLSYLRDNPQHNFQTGYTATKWTSARQASALASFSPVQIEAQRVARQQQKDLGSISRVRSLTGTGNTMRTAAQMFGGNNVAATKTVTGM